MRDENMTFGQFIRKKAGVSEKIDVQAVPEMLGTSLTMYCV